MTMAHDGIAKLIEEAGELQQVCGKILAYGMDDHPDGKGSLEVRLTEEIADLEAAIAFVVEKYSLNPLAIQVRKETKISRFEYWDKYSDRPE